MGMEAALIGGGLNLLSSSMAADSAQQAAQTAANAQLESSRLAAEEARFRPIGVTTRFGSSQFGFDPSGRLSSAGYTVSPELQAYQNRLMGLAGGGLTQAEQAQQQYAPLTGAATGLFNLGQQYLSQSPEQAAQKYMEQQQALLAPSREQQSANLMNQLSNTGRTGLSVAQGGGLMAANPEAAALANARAMQDLQLAAQAQQAGQQQTAFGAGLFGTGANLLNQYQTGQVGALSPFQAYLGATQGIESLGQQPLQIGSELGGRASSAGANAGQFLYGGGMGAARTMQPANALDPLSRTISNIGESRDFTSGLGNYFKGMGAGGGITSAGMFAPADVFGGGQLPLGYANL
jgi:hypothetical protein